ncbi:MAG: ABC transporter permease subunit, partial [Leptospiraceae bacterium]|nr:ABC transporter permease subunit [Leptospiraceae bacterium]
FNERSNHEEATIFTFLAFMLTIIIAMLILSMGSIVEEKSKGTLELLFSSPVSDLEIISAKFLFGLSICFIITVFINALFPLFLIHFWQAPFYIIISGSVGIFLLGIFTYSIGIFGSSIASRQVISLLTSILIILFLWVLGFFSHLFSETTRKVLYHFHIFSHFIAFARGTIPFSGIVFFLSGSFFFNFLALKYLESRRWRG